MGDKDTRALRMQISVSGGLQSERVQLDAAITGEGHLEGRVENSVTDRAGSFDGQISDDRLRDLIALIASDDFVHQPREPALSSRHAVASVEVSLAASGSEVLAPVDPDQVPGTDAVAEPTSRLVAMVIETADAMVEGGPDPR